MLTNFNLLVGPGHFFTRKDMIPSQYICWSMLLFSSHWVDYTSFLILCFTFSNFNFLMQILFIGPVYLRRKLEIASSRIFKEGTPLQNLKVGDDNEDINYAIELIKTRLKNIVKRPKKSGSKVSIWHKNFSNYMLGCVSMFDLFVCQCRHQIRLLDQKNVYFYLGGAQML